MDSGYTQVSAVTCFPEGDGDHPRTARLNDSASASTAEALHKLTTSLHDMDLHLEPIVETDSIYGCAIAMPQIWRSSNWHHTFYLLAFRAIFNLFLNIFLQMSLLVFVAEATQVMNALGGQMHLCDFGKDLEQCPEGDHCMGPGGTLLTKDRVYSFSQWSTRNFARQALLDILPHLKDEIYEKVDPGEYAMENYYCRFFCGFLFTMSVVEELLRSVGLIRLLWMLPSENQDWIEYDLADKADFEFRPLDHVTFKVAGMSRWWKLLTMSFVVLPKVYICHNVLMQGMVMIMETSAIMDQILSAMSMTFIIGIDEMVYSIFASSAAKHVMGHMNQYWSNARLEHFQESESKHSRCRCRLLLIVPRRFVLVFSVMCGYVAYYYVRNCKFWKGAWVSDDMYTPESPTYYMTDYILGTIHHTVSSAPFWSISEIDKD